jgi:hypothetical protein
MGTFVPSDAAAYLSRLHPSRARYKNRCIKRGPCAPATGDVARCPDDAVSTEATTIKEGRVSKAVSLSKDDLRAIAIAHTALEEHADFIPHETHTQQERQWALGQLAALLERASAAS